MKLSIAECLKEVFFDEIRGLRVVNSVLIIKETE